MANGNGRSTRIGDGAEEQSPIMADTQQDPSCDAAADAAIRRKAKRQRKDSIGASLREIRLTSGRDLRDIAHDLRIRIDHLEAIEAGRYDRLPGPAYACGFVRSYAEHLGLAPEEAVQSFKQEASLQNGAAPKLSFPTPIDDDRFPAKSIILISVALFAAVYIGYATTGDRSVRDVAAVPADLQNPVGEAAAESQPPAVGDGQSAPAGHDTAAAADPAAAPSTNTASDTGAGAAAGDDRNNFSAAALPAIRIRAEADAWVRITREDDSVLFEDVLHAGQRYDITDESKVLLTTGNAGALSIDAGGKAMAPLGKYGDIARDVPITSGPL